jgi:hypothetical protein
VVGQVLELAMTIRTLAPILLVVTAGAAVAEPGPRAVVAAVDPEQPPARAEPRVIDAAPVPDRPDRSGWTVEASFGGGGLWEGGADDRTRTVRSRINGSVGGFVTPTTALTLRIAGVHYQAEGADGARHPRSIGFFGPAIQQYLGDRLFLGAGLGMGVTSDDDVGASADLRIGYHLLLRRRGGVHVAAELTPAWFDSGGAVGACLQLGAQLF